MHCCIVPRSFQPHSALFFAFLHYQTDSLDHAEFPARPKPAAVAAQLIRDKRLLDANPRLNLASFVTTSVEPECLQLMQESLNVNAVDEEEYPSATEIHATCVRQMADLLHAPGVCGTATVGSSEAILLGVLAMKHRLRAARAAAGKPLVTPNIVVPSTVHVCHEKAAVYFDVELRKVPISADTYMASPADIVAQCDENTIGVVAILGSTYTGHFDDVEALDAAIGAFNAEHGTEIGIHVDGASGGFVAPFAFPDLKWDFRLPNVVSINASGHKFGLMLAGIGWILFRSRDHLPESLIFEDKYLGNDQISFSLNFSKTAAQIVGQAYIFQRLGRAGFQQVIRSCHDVSQALAAALASTGDFVIHSPAAPTPGVPLVSWSIADHKKGLGFTEFDLADVLRERGWVVPAYPLAQGAEHITVLRAVCREDFSPAMAASLARHAVEGLAKLEDHAKRTKSVAAATRATASWRAAANKAHAKVRAAAAAVGEEPKNGVDFVGRHGSSC